MVVTFKITDQTHEWVYGSAGTRTGQWIITFETPSGVQSQILVVDTHYVPEHVAELIAAQVHRIEAVQHLEHGPEPVHKPAHHHA